MHPLPTPQFGKEGALVVELHEVNSVPDGKSDGACDGPLLCDAVGEAEVEADVDECLDVQSVTEPEAPTPVRQPDPRPLVPIFCPTWWPVLLLLSGLLVVIVCTIAGAADPFPDILHLQGPRYVSPSRNSNILLTDGSERSLVTRSVFAFVGVNPGYNFTAFTICSAVQAATLVASALVPLQLQAVVYPGRVLYPGCPLGGEVAGTLVIDTAPPDLLTTIGLLGRALQQRDIVVITDPALGMASQGLVVELGEGELDALALQWQEQAALQEQHYGLYVSGGVFRVDCLVYGRADVRLHNTKDVDHWMQAARALVQNVTPGCNPVFYAAGYSVLHDTMEQALHASEDVQDLG